MKRQLTSLLICLTLLPLTMFAGAGILGGEVRDGVTRQRLSDVNVNIENSNIGAATDANGRYEIRMVTTGTLQLRATRPGYSSRVITDVVVHEERITDRDDLKVSLTGYQRWFRNLPLHYALTTSDSLDGGFHYVNEGEGDSRGLEFFMQQRMTRGYYYLISLALSRAERIDPKDGSSRYPHYSRFDIRFDRRFFYGRTNLVTCLEVENLFDRENLFKYDYTGDGERLAILQFRRFIVGGVVWEF